MSTSKRSTNPVTPEQLAAVQGNLETLLKLLVPNDSNSNQLLQERHPRRRKGPKKLLASNAQQPQHVAGSKARASSAALKKVIRELANAPPDDWKPLDLTGVPGRTSSDAAESLVEPGSFESLANVWQADVDFVGVYLADPIERIEMGKAGVPATAVGVMARQLHLTNDRFMRLLGLVPATVKRKAKTESVLDPNDSARMIGLASLVGQVTQIVQESGDLDGFDACQWVSEWMDEPIPALGNRKPSELMDTSEGQVLLSDLIARMQSGAYS